ncbi:MAG TPA: hypothetical protein PKE55_04645 [Kiritimatiellia bacterium]|nr:hypothetical protein [Kiritimatiellia bacterium]
MLGIHNRGLRKLIESAYRVAWIISGLLWLTACGRSPEVSPRPENLDPVAASIRDLTGARTRIVWVQDVGDGSDYLARGTGLRLMGLDTDDHRGEREILPTPRNFVKPLFTSDGKHILFSDRIHGTMHRVAWEGGDVEDLGQGFAAAVWRDPETRVQWLYYLRDFIEDGNLLPTHGSLYRKPLTPLPRNRTRDTGGVVMSDIQISEDSFQLTADGRLASAAFPWPEVGYLNLDNQTWHRLGRGCWVAMAPDAPYHFWVLDGPHRNLTLFQIDPFERWMVNISQLPGHPGYEVYHPRWSNHSHILAVTGPYKVGEGAYRLSGGGADVEVYLGRFSEDRREVAAWVRATFNAFANFYPDVWVEPDPRGQTSQPFSAALPATRDWTWPVEDTSLVYLWQTLNGRHEVPASDSRPALLCRPEPFGHARYGRHFEMLIENGGFRDREAGRRAVEALAGASTFSLELTVHQDREVEEEAGVVFLSLAGSETDLVSIGREGGRAVFQMGDQRVESEPIHWPATFHLVASVDSGQVHVYREGEVILQADMRPIDWPADQGGELRLGDGRWVGSLEGIAIYARALTAREAQLNSRLYRQTMTDRTRSTVYEVEGRIVATSSIPSPADIAPYRRALVANEVDVTFKTGEGPITQRILVAHWALLDAEVLPTAERVIGEVYAMRLEPFDNRPELEGERLAIDTDDLLLDLYFDHQF